MAIIAEGAILSTKKGYIKVENYNGEDVLTNNGFKPIEINKVDYSGQLVRLTVWSFLDDLFIASDSRAIGTTYHNCPDLGNVGPCLCKPYNRCWDQCPDDHPEKIHMQNPKDLSFREIRKNSYIISPKTGNIIYSHKTIKDQTNQNKTYKEFYNRGFIFGKKYKDLLEEMPSTDVEYIMYSDPMEYMSYICGWQDSMGGVVLDMWEYRFVLKNKELAYQTQFLLNYFGTPTAMSAYHSNDFGDNCYLISFCKYKKPFHYKTFDYNNKRYTIVKKWTPFTTDNELIKNKQFYEIKSDDYFCCPFLCK